METEGQSLQPGESRMVDVGGKDITQRMARATGTVNMAAETLDRVRRGQLTKGDPISVARIAGVMAAKRTHDLIPLCHPIPLDSVTVEFSFPGERTIEIQAEVKATARTGVEMEALTAVTAAALTIYDMCKSMDRAVEITAVQLLEKLGGRSGHYRRDDQ